VEHGLGHCHRPRGALGARSRQLLCVWWIHPRLDRGSDHAGCLPHHSEPASEKGLMNARSRLRAIVAGVEREVSRLSSQRDGRNEGRQRRLDAAWRELFGLLAWVRSPGTARALHGARSAFAQLRCAAVLDQISPLVVPHRRDDRRAGVRDPEPWNRDRSWAR